MNPPIYYFTLFMITIVMTACSKATTDATSDQQVANESRPAKMKAAKFEDVNNCSQYSNVFAALPQLDTYQNIDFHVLECQSTELESAFSTALDVKYGDQKSRNNFSVAIFEVKGKSAAQELNSVALAKASYQMAEQMAQNPGPKMFVKSNLTKLDFATISIHDAPNDGELSNATYTGVYKDAHAITLGLEMQGKIEQAQFETYIADYLNAIKLDQLN
jgi:hypothetical protein